MRKYFARRPLRRRIVALAAAYAIALASLIASFGAASAAADAAAAPNGIICHTLVAGDQAPASGDTNSNHCADNCCIGCLMLHGGGAAAAGENRRRAAVGEPVHRRRRRTSSSSAGSRPKTIVRERLHWQREARRPDPRRPQRFSDANGDLHVCTSQMLARLRAGAAVRRPALHRCVRPLLRRRALFPATLAIDDPCVADELSLPTVSWSRTADMPPATEWDVSAEFSKRITEDFGISIGDTWTQIRHPGGADHGGLRQSRNHGAVPAAQGQLARIRRCCSA